MRPGIKGLAVFVCLLIALPAFAQAQCTQDATLTDSDRQAFVSAAFGADAMVWVELLSASSCEGTVARAAVELDAQVHYRDDKVGYVLLRIARSKLLDVLDLRGVDAATIPSLVILPTPPATGDKEIARIPPFVAPFPRVATTLPDDGPYFPAAEAGLTDFWTQHPDADGRGVRIAAVDDGFDLLHPAMQQARDAAGAIVPKVAGLDATTQPEIDDNWVTFGPGVQSTDGVLRAAGRDWHVPVDAASQSSTSGSGAYRFGIYRHTVTLGLEYDAKARPIPKAALSAGVLWHEPTGRVWLDTDGDGDFRNERTLTDYSRRHEIAWFGSRDESADHRIPFGIKIDPDRQAVYVSIGGLHGAFIGGAIAANRMTGGLFDGAAPAAQLIDVRSGVTLIPSLLRALARDDADVVNRSGLIAMDLASGTFSRRVFERALAVYQKPLVCFCNLPNALHVNDYQSAEMLRRNRQLPPPHGEAMNSATSFNADGLSNVVLAPSTSLLASSRYAPVDVEWEDHRRHMTKDRLSPPAPDGYGIGANNSPTIAFASGIVADLIGLARAKEVRFDYIRLMHAIFTSTRQVPGYPAARQGYGLIDAAGAWRQLVKMAAADDPAHATLTSFTVARDRDGAAPVHGFHADLVKAGGVIKSDLWLTRRGGHAGPRRYRLGLRADDGTYRLLDERVTLVRDVPARIRLSARAEPGQHVAFLQIKDEQADVVMQEVPLMVRAPERPGQAAPGVEVYRRTLAPRNVERMYFRIEEGVQAMRVAVDAPWTGPAHLSLRSLTLEPEPAGGRVSFTSPATAPDGPPVDAAHHVGPMEHFARQTASVRAGTGSFLWENRGRPEYETPYDPPAPDVPVTATLTLKKYAVRFRPEGQTVHVTNVLADVEGRVESYDAKVVSHQLVGRGTRASAEFEHPLAEGVSQWRVSLTGASLTGTDVADAWLLDCTNASRGCVVVDRTSITKNTKAGATLVAEEPAAGVWRVVTRTRGRAAGPIDYAIRHASLTPTTSGVPIQPDAGKHVSGARWSFTAPRGSADAQYVAYRLAPGERDGGQKEKGIRIAMTPLQPDAP
jgi:hypothetical protein